MDPSTDVLIVAGANDGVAKRVRETLEHKRRRVAVLDGPSASRLFTIRVRPDGTSVSPEMAMFVRASAWYHDATSEHSDQRFLRAEAFSTFWAAATLSTAPVINRPGRSGFTYRMTWGAIAAALQLDLEKTGPEIHSSAPENLAEQAGDKQDELWGENSNYLTAPLAQLPRGIPLRARKVNPAALYEVITVVGNRGFSATLDQRTNELDLTGQSVSLAVRMAVQFATVTWAVDERGATPVRLNSAPEMFEMRYAWREIADALCQELGQ